MAKKIVYIGSFFNLWDEEGNAQAFESLGHKVFRFQEDEIDHIKALNEIEKINPDLVVHSKLKIKVGRDQLMAQLRKKYPTVYWSFDLYLGYHRDRLVGTDPLFKSKYVMTPDGGHDEVWKKRGINHKLLRQGICKDFCYKGKVRSEYKYDVVFVGTENRLWIDRTLLCSALQMSNFRFKWFGQFNTLQVRGHNLNDLYASAKIVVGDSVYSPYYWSNRIYETLGRGGFLIHLDIPGLRDEYKAYEHFIPYKLGNLRGLTEKIEYYLKHPEERARIASQAQEWTIKNHTLERRCEQLFKYIGL